MSKYLPVGVLLIAVVALYLLTLDNGLRPEELAGGDLITHQYAQVEARPSNAPGYPLYTMGGWLWYRLGRLLLGRALNPIQILSFYSTLWGLASLLILYLILREIGGWPGLALGLTAFYAVTYFFWYYSVTTEQYTSAVFQGLLLIWLAFRWDDDPRDSTLLGMAFLSGTMLANMVTTLFMLPPLLWFIFWRETDEDLPCHSEPPAAKESPPPQSPGDSSATLATLAALATLATLGITWKRVFSGRTGLAYLKRPGLILQAVGLALLPLLSYAYVYIRGAQHPEWRGAGQWATDWDWFIQFLTIQQGRDELAPGLTWANFFTEQFPALMWQELTWPLFIGGLLGLAWLSRRRTMFLYSTLLIYLLFCWGYRHGNWFQVIIPAYPIFVIGAAAGLRRTPGRWRIAVSLGLALLIGYRFWLSWPEANQRNQPEDTGLKPGWTILADQPQTPALISADFEERLALEYLHTIWRAAPAIHPAAAGTLTPPAGVTVDYRYATRRAVTPRLADSWHLQAAGQRLIRQEAAPRLALPPEAIPLAVDFGDGLRLAGWRPIPAAYEPPPGVAVERANWHIALYWQAVAAPGADYTISVRPLVGGQPIFVAGEPLIQDHQPVWGAYPTTRWRPGELIRDDYALSLPLRPEAFQVVVYRPTATGFENLAEAVIVVK